MRADQGQNNPAETSKKNNVPELPQEHEEGEGKKRGMKLNTVFKLLKIVAILEATASVLRVRIKGDIGIKRFPA